MTGCFATTTTPGDTYISVVGRGEHRQSGPRIKQASYRGDSGNRNCHPTHTAQHGKASAATLAGHRPSQQKQPSRSTVLTKPVIARRFKPCSEHIEAGDIYQACMTQRFQSDLGNHDPWNLYCHLRVRQPGSLRLLSACTRTTFVLSVHLQSAIFRWTEDRMGRKPSDQGNTPARKDDRNRTPHFGRN